MYCTRTLLGPHAENPLAQWNHRLLPPARPALTPFFQPQLQMQGVFFRTYKLYFSDKVMYISLSQLTIFPATCASLPFFRPEMSMFVDLKYKSNNLTLTSE